MPRTRTGDGQTALVTGASAGIGVDLAECFAADGYNLILTARTESALRDVADRLAQTYGVTATPIAADLAAIGGGRKLADAIAQSLQGFRPDQRQLCRCRVRLWNSTLRRNTQRRSIQRRN